MIGEESFKGVMIFSKTLVQHVSGQNCTYNPISTITRMCLPPNGTLNARWGPVDLTKCHSKSPATDSLIELSKVNICIHNNTSSKCLTEIQLAARLSHLIVNGYSITTRKELIFINTIFKKLSTSNLSAFNNRQKALEVTL